LMLFEIDAADRQARMALIEAASGRSWTFRDLSFEVAQRVRILGGSGAGLLFLFCRNDLDSVAWYIAAIEAGKTVALLNGRLDRELANNLVSLYKPDMILGISPWEGSDYKQEGEGLWRRGAADDLQLFPNLALLLSTSGSTGSPKFVRLTRANVEANARSILEALRINPDHRPIAHLPLYYSYGLSVVNSHLAAGATTILAESALISVDFWSAVRRNEVNSFSGVPYTYQTLKRLGLDKLNVPQLRIMTQAGGRLDPSNISWFHEKMRERGGEFWTMYGQTEATARIAILEPDQLPARLGFAGCAIPSGRLSILTDSGQITTDANVEGELVYEGPNVMLGYALNRQDLAKGDELGGQLFTGDRAVLDDDGFVRILGRVKRDAKVFGLRINLDEIEALVRPKGPVAALAGSDRIVLFCEFGDAVQHAALGAELASKLGIHHSAFDFRHITKLPTRDTGKIAYETLQELL